MKTLRKHKVVKIIASGLLVNIMFSIIYPTVSFALTSGPSSPEFSTFQPVATTDMVNTFSGDFSYNIPALEIPGPEGAGYALSLSYNSGASVEEEASWVGFGWNLNPGAINRSLRGFPDDYNGETVDFFNKSRVNWSCLAKPSIAAKVFGLRFGMTPSLRYNNYQGYWSETGFGLSAAGMVNLQMTTSNKGTTFSASVNPIAILNSLSKSKKQKEKEKAAALEANKNKSKDTRTVLKRSLDESVKSLKGAGENIVSGAASTYGFFAYGEQVRPTTIAEYYGFTTGFMVSGQVNPAPIPAGFEGGYQTTFNLQINTPRTNSATFGFLHNKDYLGTDMTDYYVEKNSPFTKRDYFIGMPFQNYDNFSVSGEGIGGGFRFYQDNVGTFYPRQVKSTLVNFQMGLEFMVGPDVGGGVNIGAGSAVNEIKKWTDIGTADTYKFQGNNGYFRFGNDLGGSVNYSSNVDFTTANVDLVNKLPGFKTAEANVPGGDIFPNTGKSTTSYIDYTTGKEGSKFNKSSNVNDLMNPGGDRIIEFSTYNEQGMNYVYGLPVFVKNETSIHVDVNSPGDGFTTYNNLFLKDNDGGYEMDIDKHQTISGDIKKNAYASSYLLTQITSPDYVDRSNNGPSQDDFGGWTKFSYFKKYGNGTQMQWYRFRSPYTGLSYARNTLSDKKDDMGSVVTGQKEVYFLKQIETKTHIAYFITNKSVPSRFENSNTLSHPYLRGSGQDRLDAMGAAEVGGSSDPAASSNTARGNTKLEYLEKIVLFSKDRPDKPLKIMNFSYDYSLVKNVPNNINSGYPNGYTNLNCGKLTLKKVWFEYDGVVNAKISPYVFTYQYKAPFAFPDEVKKRYPEITNYALQYAASTQNPDYDPSSLDVWGHVQPFGKERKKYDVPWVYQGNLVLDSTTNRKDDWRNIALKRSYFDPGAWQLKQIRLPSGGEILVQYEEHDYSYVQNRKVMAMASLLGATNEGQITEHTILAPPKYIINPEDLGVNPKDRQAVQKLDDAIKEYFGNDKEKIYFKFLYDMLGFDPNLDNCSSEYISGYANFKSSEVTNLRDSKYGITITLESDLMSQTLGIGKKPAQPPKQGCYDFATQNRGKMYKLGNECLGSLGDVYDQVIQAANNKENTPAFNMFNNALAALDVMRTLPSQFPMYYTFGKENLDSYCLTLNPQLSYFKLPMITSKRAGGARVKRILMFDPGIESGDASIYGSEYIYKNSDGTSSGVATNEAPGAREENPLVTFLPKKEQDWFSRLTVGDDMSQTEGPIGESILPGASIGYGRVVTKNIHSGKTGTGFTVNEYFTVKDYPYDKTYDYGSLSSQGSGRQFDITGNVRSTDFSDLSSNKKEDFLNIPAGIFNFSTNKVWSSQGFTFIHNNMHGQMKKVTTYNGDYSNPTTASISSVQENTYFEPGEKIRVLYPDGTYKFEMPGKEMDVAMHMQEVKDNTVDFSINIEISIATFPLFFVYGVPSFSMSDMSISTHSTTKVTRYPAILKSVKSYQDGVYSTTENLAFSKTTGKPLLVKTTDSYDKLKLDNKIHDGSLYTFSYPAHWIYGEMGSKSTNASYTNQLNTMAAQIVTYGKGGNPLVPSNVPASMPNGTWNIPSKNVIQASAQTFSKNWGFAMLDDDLIKREYDLQYSDSSALNHIYRPLSNYVFSKDITSANLCDTCRTYNSGTIKNFVMFDWGKIAQSKNAGWREMNTVSKYSPNGIALEEKNILNIYSSAKYGYRGQILPVMLSKNAQYSSIAFEDFENDLTASSDAYAHSGNKVKPYSSSYSLFQNKLKVDQQLKSKGGLLKFWYKTGTNDSPNLSVYANSNLFYLKKVASTGKWSLYEVKIDFSSETIGTYITLTLNGGSSDDFIDDIRFQPYDSQSTCYVYDVKSLRLLMQFDDQHFGMIYQYNDEGKLVRKLVETERGVRTLQETQYNLPDNFRGQFYE